MPRPDPREPKDGQLGMFAPAEVQKPSGNAESQIRRAITARIVAGFLDADLDAGSSEVAAAVGRAVDAANAANSFGSVLRNASSIFDALGAAGLTPQTREVDGDGEIERLLNELGGASAPHTP